MAGGSSCIIDIWRNGDWWHPARVMESRQREVSTTYCCIIDVSIGSGGR